MKMNLIAKSMVAMVLTAGVAGAALATPYSNTPGLNINYMGYPDTTTYGETFQAPGGNLQDWTFYLNGGNAGNGNFVIAAWDGNKAVGPVLYQQGFSYTPGANVPMTFTGIDLGLTSGNSYVAYMTIAGVNSPYSNVSTMGSQGDGGLGGHFAYLNSQGVDPLTLQKQWDTFYIPNMQFSADFGDAANVPEPASLAIFGLGIAGLIVRRKAPKK